MRFTEGPHCGGFYRAEGVQGRCPLGVLTAYGLGATQAAGEADGEVAAHLSARFWVGDASTSLTPAAMS